VVGVISAFRQHGEYAMTMPYLFFRNDLVSRPGADVPSQAVIRTRPGTTAAFEETLIRRLQAIAPTWSFTLDSDATMRDTVLRGYVTPLAVAGVLAGFLLLMVALGLTGVLWQSVTQRTREFGVRRAEGATSSAVAKQVTLESVVLTSFAIALGAVLAVQLPLLPWPDDLPRVSRTIFIGGLAAAAGIVYLVALLSSLYPSWLASRAAPADALHYE
jgi:putative ABC transport system permease protein